MGKQKSKYNQNINFGGHMGLDMSYVQETGSPDPKTHGDKVPEGKREMGMSRRT